MSTHLHQIVLVHTTLDMFVCLCISLNVLGGVQNRWSTEQVEYRTGGVQNRWSTEQVEYRTGGVQNRWGTEQVEYRTGGVQNRWSTEQVGYRTGGVQNRWSTEQLAATHSYYIVPKRVSATFTGCDSPVPPTILLMYKNTLQCVL